MLRRIAAGTVALPLVGASAASVCAPVRHAALNIDQLIKSVTEVASPKAKAKASAKAPATEFDDDSLSEVFAGLSGNPAASAPPAKRARGKARAAKVVDDDAWLTDMLSSAPAESAPAKVTRGRAKRTPQATSSDASVDVIMESLGISQETAKAPARRSRAAKSEDNDNAADLDDIIAAVKKGTRTRRSTKPAPKAKAAKTRAPAKRRAQAAKQAPTRGRRAVAKAAAKAPQKKTTSVVLDDLVSTVLSSQAAQAPKKTAAAGGKINVDDIIATTLTSGKATADGPQIVEKDVTGTLLLQTGGFSAINLDELPSDKYATTFGSFVVAMQLPNIPPATRVKCDLIVNPVHKHFSNTSQLMAINVRKL